MSRASYHQLPRQDFHNNKNRWRIGLEIEKEDYEVLNSINHHTIYDDLGWCIERDGSLNENSGFEAVSPVLTLFDDKQINDNLSALENIINAKQSKSCGGHIHISNKYMTPEQLFDHIAFYFPLFFALYKHRIGNFYSQAGSKEQMKSQSSRRMSFAVREQSVEIRIFPSPKSVFTLKWRIDLLKIIVKNPLTNYMQLLETLTNTKSQLFRHLAIVFNTPDKYFSKLREVILMVSHFEGQDIDNPQKMNKFEKRLRKKFDKEGSLNGTMNTVTLTEEESE